MSAELGMLDDIYSQTVRVPKSIVNFCSGGGGSVTTGAAPSATKLKQINSGALTANTLATVLSITGGGEINILTVVALDVTSRTVRAKLTLDGTVVFDATSSAVTAVGSGLLLVGGVPMQYDGGAGRVPPPERVPFNSSLLLEVASSLTETDKLAAGISYKLY